MKEMMTVIFLAIAMAMAFGTAAHAQARKPSLGAMIQIGQKGILKISTKTSRGLDRELGVVKKEMLFTDMIKMKDITFIQKKYRMTPSDRHARKTYVAKVLELYAKLRATKV